METWKSIPGFTGYEVSDQGNVRSYKKQGGGEAYEIPHLLKPSKRNGYKGVNLCSNGQRYFKKVAFLVLLAFIGPRPGGMEVCHSNSNPSDDRLENLRYDTPLGNQRDRLNLTDTQVIEMRTRRARGEQISNLAKLFDINYNQARRICRGDSFAGIGGAFTTSGRGLGGGKLTIDDIIAVRIERATTDITLKNLGKKYGLSKAVMSRICSGKAYRNDGGPLTIGKVVYKKSK